jgi:hypothetical protein
MYGRCVEIQAVVPTIPGREQLLRETVASLEERGIDPVVVPNSPSCGEGWAIGLEASCADYVLLASDDIEVSDISRLETAVARASAGLVVSPVIVNADGSLQGAGGFGQRLEDGALARTTIFPFASRQTFQAVSPWPPSNHYCDSWISECAWMLGRGPVVTHGFALVHKIIAPTSAGEVEAYDSWRTDRLQMLPDATRRRHRPIDEVFRSLEGRNIVVAGIRGRSQTELRLASAGLPAYIGTSPRRAVGGSRRALLLAREGPTVRARANEAARVLASARWRGLGVVRRAVGLARARVALRTRMRKLLSRRASLPQREEN